MIKKLNQHTLKETMNICFEMEELYFSLPFNERLKLVIYIYNLLSNPKQNKTNIPVRMSEVIL